MLKKRGEFLQKIGFFVYIASLFFLDPFFFVSCTHTPSQFVTPALHPNSAQPEVLMPSNSPFSLQDDIGILKLRNSIKEHITYLEKQGGNPVLHFGHQDIERKLYLKALHRLVEDTEKFADNEFYLWVKKNFQFFEASGKDHWGEVLFTSYYNPIIKGSHKKQKNFSQALYKAPNDMVFVDLAEFAQVIPESSKDLLPKLAYEQRVLKPFLRGRLIAAEAPRVVPFFNRKEIDANLALKGKHLELAWVNPVDAYFMQIQGSGIIEFGDGTRLTLTYSSQNGHPYVAIGKYLFDKIPKEEMTMEKIESYLRSLSPQERQEILNKNPSYVFFEQGSTNAKTSLGMEVVDGRTIATDPRFFPKGALGYIQLDYPQFSSPKQRNPEQWHSTSRFVLDQDTGGAIRGPQRVDLFAGTGNEAKKLASVIKRWGKLYYLFPKEEFLLRL